MFANVEHRRDQSVIDRESEPTVWLRRMIRSLNRGCWIWTYTFTSVTAPTLGTLIECSTPLVLLSGMARFTGGVP